MTDVGMPPDPTRAAGANVSKLAKRIQEARAVREAAEAAAESKVQAAPAEPIPGLEDVETTEGPPVKRRAELWLDSMLKRQISEMRSIPEGGRNNTFYYFVRCYVEVAVHPEVRLPYETPVELLRQAALLSGMDKARTNRTAASAVKAGKKNPKLPKGFDTPWTPDSQESVVIEVEDDPDEPEEPEPALNAEPLSEEDYPTYDLRKVLPGKNTFLDIYCAEALKLPVPREFPLWVGLALLSTAIGREAALKTSEFATYSNLAVCLTGGSASGKGRSINLGIKVLRKALPFDDTPVESGIEAEGVLIKPLPGSGEQLVKDLDLCRRDATTKRVISKHTCVTLVKFDEMDRFVSKAGGKDQNAYKSYIQDFADGVDEIETNAGNSRSTVYDGFVTFLTSTQPGHLRSQFTQRDKASGFLNRFIFAFGRYVPSVIFSDLELEWELAAGALKVTHNWVADLTKNSPDGKSYWYSFKRPETLWAPEAIERLQRFNSEVLSPDKGNLGLGETLGRMDINVLRLILLLAVNSQSKTIELEFVEAAIHLHAYMRECALTLTREMATTEMSEQMKVILAAVEKIETTKKRPPSKRELDRASTVVKNMGENEFTTTVSRLIQAGRLHRVISKSKNIAGGRTANCWSSMPAGQWKSPDLEIRPASGK